MNTIVLDQQAANLLKECQGKTPLRDQEGNVVGIFERRLYDPALIPEFDEAELDRREADFQGIPSAEVRRRLLEELR